MKPDFKVIFRLLKILLVSAFGVLLLGGFWFYQAQEQAVEKKVENDLGAIARLKAEQIAAWRKNQLQAAAALQNYFFLLQSVTSFMAGQGQEQRRDLLLRLRNLAKRHGYADIMLADPGGQVLLSLVAAPDCRCDFESALAQAWSAHAPVFTSLHLESSDTFPHLALIMPLYHKNGLSVLPLAALIMVNDASSFLYPLVRFWPTPSDSAETLLVQRDGDEVLFLNDLRHRSDTALKLRLPLSRTETPAVMAGLGRQGFVRGRDYRGVKVVAVILPIPDSPWIMIAKIDEAEVFAEWRFRSALILALFMLLAACIGALGLVMGQRNKKAYYRALYFSEAALRAGEQRHRVTLKAIGDAVIATDGRGLVELLNPVAENLTGWSQAEACGRPLTEIFRIINEETRNPVEDPVAKVLRQGTIVGLANHTLLVARDGVERPIADSGAPIRNEKGVISGVVLVFRDQTREREAERTLRAELARSQSYLDTVETVIVALDEKGDISLINRKGCELLGRRAAELKGRNWFDNCLPAENKDEVSVLFSQIVAGKVEPFEYHENEVIACNGERRTLAWHNALLRDETGAITGVLSAGEDISERKIMEERLRHVTAVLRGLRKVNQLIIHEKNREILLRRAGEILVETRGYHSAWVALREGLGELRVVAAAGVGDNFAKLRSELENGVWPECCRRALAGPEVVLGHGTKADCHVCPLAHTYGDTAALAGALRHAGEEYGVLVAALPVGVADDVEERALFAELCGDLAFALHGLAVDQEHDKLRTQLNQAQKMEAVGRLAGGVAHDFNNILSVIIGYSELALNKVAAETPLHKDLQEILAAAARSRDIVRQLLAFARKENIAPQVLDLNAGVQNMLKILRRLIGEDLDLVWHPGNDLWPVLLDPSQLDQILANLCVNARDAISDVGKVSIETAKVSFDEAYCALHAEAAPGDFVLLAVSDDGCGMDREIVAQIFEPFFSTKGAGRGTGMGLSTVYGIVKQNQGFINVYSEPGEGTSFRIYLPRYMGAELPEKPVPVPEKIHPGAAETVLVVEDEFPILELVKTILTQLNYRVLTAPTPSDALRMAAEHDGEIDLLLTDVVMPEMNGRELSGRLQALYPKLKCLYMSGYTANVIVHRGVLDKGCQFIQKPFSTRDLAAKIRMVLADK